MVCNGSPEAFRARPFLRPFQYFCPTGSLPKLQVSYEIPHASTYRDFLLEDIVIFLNRERMADRYAKGLSLSQSSHAPVVSIDSLCCPQDNTQQSSHVLDR
jgi:hypothetical protein